MRKGKWKDSLFPSENASYASFSSATRTSSLAGTEAETAGAAEDYCIAIGKARYKGVEQCE
jgi:hypothetical protein